MPSNAHLYNNAPTSYTYNNLTNYQTNLIIHNCKLKSRYLSSAKSSAREVKLSGQDRIAALLLLLTRIEYHCRFRTIHHQLFVASSVITIGFLQPSTVRYSAPQPSPDFMLDHPSCRRKHPLKTSFNCGHTLVT